MKFLCMKMNVFGKFCPKTFTVKNSMHEIVHSPITMKISEAKKSSQRQFFYFHTIK